jgi:hypothetical protein
MRVTADMIPHEEFHKGVWLLPAVRPLWYYFGESLSRPAAASRDLIQTVDRALRELVIFLQEAGIRTTPSCSGHDHSPRHYSRIYDALDADADEIRGPGLWMRDVESGERYSFQRADYRLPWNKPGFIEKALQYQLQGVIGFKLGRPDTPRVRRLLSVDMPGVSVKRQDGTLIIRTDASRDGDCASLWKKVTREMKKIIESRG